MLKRRFGWVFCFLFFLAASLQAQIDVLHSFAGGASDGANPQGSSALILKGYGLYGMTYKGGTANVGTVFKINTNGTGFELLHSFAGGASDGANPEGSLILKGSTLYGMTNYGGAYDYGTIFKINTNGTGFAVLHSFYDGLLPYGSLILKGSTLYGMTFTGGGNGYGTIFKINTNGTGFATLHSFAGASDGAGPVGSLILKGSTLYGMTSYGGPSDDGTIFKINTKGTLFTLLHSFSGTSDGKGPYGSLIVKGSGLYGMTRFGGTSDCGTIFKINTSGTGFALLHTFAGGASDGKDPGYGSLILKGKVLYGMTGSGGTGSYGTIFAINTIGTAFELIHSFVGGYADGRTPCGSLILKGSTLYGMTVNGGTSDKGVIFSFSLK